MNAAKVALGLIAIGVIIYIAGKLTREVAEEIEKEM